MKYIFSMVAGLFVMTAAACNEEKKTEAGAEKESAEKTAEAAVPATPLTPATPAEAEVVAPSAYYVMIKGDGG